VVRERKEREDREERERKERADHDACLKLVEMLRAMFDQHLKPTIGKRRTIGKTRQTEVTVYSQ